MQKRSITNFNSAGFGSLVLFLLLAFMVVNPVIGLPAYADEQLAEEDHDISTFSTLSQSGIGISFIPDEANAPAVTPIDSTVQRPKIDVQAKVNITDSGSYWVYVSSNSSQLESQHGDTIESVKSVECDSQKCTAENMPANRWGYSFQKGTTAKNEYTAIPTASRGTPVDENTDSNIKSEERTYTLSFVAGFDNTTPAGQYTNSITMSVVSSPRQVVFDDITTMQQMTNAICEKAEVGDEKQLEDVRDGKYYWVGKFKSGTGTNDYRCWMTQNLDLDFPASKQSLTNQNTNLVGKTSYSPTATQQNSITINTSNTGENSWSVGDYYLTDPKNVHDCGYGSGNTSAAACVTKSSLASLATPTEADGNTNAHYILGNFYQWNTATAGTGGTITSGQATSSICPYGWQLPTSNNTNVGSFGGIIDGNSIGSSVSTLTGEPYYFARSGYIDQDTSKLYTNAGYYGRYWSSTPTSRPSDADYAYNLFFYDSNDIIPSRSSLRYFGFSVRCINNPDI